MREFIVQIAETRHYDFSVQAGNAKEAEFLAVRRYQLASPPELKAAEVAVTTVEAVSIIARPVDD